MEISRQDINKIENKLDIILEKQHEMAVTLAAQKELQRRIEVLESNQGKFLWAVITGWLSAIGSIIYSKFGGG